MKNQIFRLAIPNIVSNLTVPLLGMADMAMMGHLESASYIGAVALGSVIFNFIYVGFAFLRMGTSGLSAQAYGARNLRESVQVLQRALITGAVLSVVLLLFQWPIAGLSFSVLNGSSVTESLAAQYFYIRIWSAPATLAIYSFNGWFIGMQNTKIPMVIAIMENVLNIAFNMMFVLGFGMKSDGVALGTVLAHYSGLLLCIWFYYRYYGKLNNYFDWQMALNLSALKSFFKLNADIFIRTILLVFALSFFTAKSAIFGDTLLASNALMFQFFFFFSYLIDGFAYAAEALTGKFKGAGNSPALKKAVKLLLWYGFILSFAFTLIYGLAGNSILQLLTSQTEVIIAAKPYMIWLALIPLASFAAFVLDGVFIGATASQAMRNSMILAVLVIYLPAYYLLEGWLGNHGLWLAFILFLASRGISLALLLPTHVFHLSPKM